MMLQQIPHIRRRQRILRESIAYGPNFELWEESCVPSYCHSNPIAAYVSWLRLFAAVGLAKRLKPESSRVLDFGSSVGELAHLLPAAPRYDFVEMHEPAAQMLIKQVPGARRVTLEEAPEGAYDQVFAIDSLEHNDNYRELLPQLLAKVSPDGVFVLSGPTENWLYRFGRRIAGFDGHYHETDIHAIERATAQLARRRGLKRVFPGATLFRISVWQPFRPLGDPVHSEQV